MFRFVGLSFLVPGVVSPALSTSFAAPAAYGDEIAALLAIVATIALTARVAWATAVVWLFNLWGTCDLLYAFYPGSNRRGYRSGDPRRGVLHSDSCRAAAADHACNDFLVAVADRSMPT